MKTWLRWVGGLVLLVGSAGFSACGSDDEPEIDHEGLRMCCELGAYCHVVGVAAEQRQNCHNVGHAGDAAACRAIYDDCMVLCADNADASEHYCAE
jgi:hypothetical protein